MSWISEYPGWHHIMQYPDIAHDFSFLLLLCNDQDIVHIGYICTCRSTVCCMRGELLMPYPSKPKASENIALSAKCGDITRVILGRAWASPADVWNVSHVCLFVCMSVHTFYGKYTLVNVSCVMAKMIHVASVRQWQSHSTSSAGKDRDHSWTCLFNHHF